MSDSIDLDKDSGPIDVVIDNTNPTEVDVVSTVSTNFGLFASLGLVIGYNTVNKFGEAIDCDSGVLTDIWDGADGSTSTDIWVPPTTARVHQLVSDATGDTAAGAGARTVRVDYLPDWDTKETSVIVTLNGTTNVALPSMVMINRMECLTWGVDGVNEGVITATADVDGTITSAILQESNQTQQCIYGVPSTQKLRVTKFLSELVKSTGATQRGDGEILMMRDPVTNVVDNTAWTNKENFLLVEANNPWNHDYRDTPKKFDGPCIVKIQVETNSNNSKVIAGFDAFLVDN